MKGIRTLLYKEVLRFWKVSFQTIAAPVLTALLYLLIFSQVMDSKVEVNGIRYTAFLIPGLIMMAILQNGFANCSSSLIQSKVSGSIIFILLPPFSAMELYLAYITAAVLRSLMVGACVLLVTSWAVPITLASPFWIVVFALLGGALMGSLGMIAGIWAEKYDQLAAFQNFLIMPLTMLSGVFYSIHSLPPFWQKTSQYNPFFYMIDGFRYGFFGVSDMPPETSFMIVGTCFVMITLLSLTLLHRGYKLRN